MNVFVLRLIGSTSTHFIAPPSIAAELLVKLLFVRLKTQLTPTSLLHSS